MSLPLHLVLPAQISQFYRPNYQSTKLERPARDKHSSLLQTFLNCGCKKFYNTGFMYEFGIAHMILCNFCRNLKQGTLTEGEGLVQLTSLYKTFKISCFNTTFFYFFTKQATLMRRSTVLSLPLQLVFPASTQH